MTEPATAVRRRIACGAGRQFLGAFVVLAAPFALLGFGWLIEQAIRAMGGS